MWWTMDDNGSNSGGGQLGRQRWQTTRMTAAVEDEDGSARRTMAVNEELCPSVIGHWMTPGGLLGRRLLFRQPLF